jgi:hypothetical protein
MLRQRCLDRVIELRPLRVAKPIEVLGLPSPLTAVAEDSVALDAGIRSTLPFKT